MYTRLLAKLSCMLQDGHISKRKRGDEKVQRHSLFEVTYKDWEKHA